MAEVDQPTLEQGHRDENNAPDQFDPKRPKPLEAERPAQTPAASQRTPDAQYPADGEDPQVRERDVVSSGIQGVYQSMRFALKEGAGRTLKSLRVVNKKGGFDCPSCAWPDPDGTRHV